jgi:hypothetical protein
VRGVDADVQEVERPHLGGSGDLATNAAPCPPVLGMDRNVAGSMERLGGRPLSAEANVMRVMAVDDIAIIDRLVANDTRLL